MRGKCEFVTMEFDGMTTKNVNDEMVEKIPASIAGLADDAVIIGTNYFRKRNAQPPTGPKGKIYRDEEAE